MLKGRTSGDILVLYNLSKSYRSILKKTTAVQDITLGIRRGEVKKLLVVPLSITKFLCNSNCWSACVILRISEIRAKAAFKFQEFLPNH